MDTIVLASRSPRRREILNRLHIPYIVFGVDVDEKIKSVLRVKSSVISISNEKVNTAAGYFSNGLVIGIDTVVYFNRKVLGKPVDIDQAYKFLRMLSGNRHYVFSGITVKDITRGISRSSCSVTEVCFTKMTDGEIKQYLEIDEWNGKAGGYAIQGQAALYIESLSGSYYNVMGLPVEELYRLLKKFNYFESDGIYRPVKKQ